MKKTKAVDQARHAERRLQYTGLELLDFDPENPRIPARLHGAPRTDILGWLLESANLPDLMRSIAAQDFFPGEPLLVSEFGNGRLKVVEGNRRFAACWLLSHPEDAPTKKTTVREISSSAEFKPRELPCLVLPEEEIEGFLGYRHITGIQEWNPLAKSRYLLRMWESTEGPDDGVNRLRWVASKIGSRRDYVARSLTTLAVYSVIEVENFFKIKGLNEETFPYSLLSLALNRQAIAEFIGLESSQDFAFEDLREDRLSELCVWLFDRTSTGRPRVPESRNIGDLAYIIESPAALQRFRDGATLRVALAVAQLETNSAIPHLEQAAEALDTASGLLDTTDSAQAERVKRLVGLTQMMASRFES